LVHNFKVEGTNEGEVLSGLRALILTGRYEPHRADGFPVAFEVPSGTLVDVLNKMTGSSEFLLLWQATYRQRPQAELRNDWGYPVDGAAGVGAPRRGLSTSATLTRRRPVALNAYAR